MEADAPGVAENGGVAHNGAPPASEQHHASIVSAKSRSSEPEGFVGVELTAMGGASCEPATPEHAPSAAPSRRGGWWSMGSRRRAKAPGRGKPATNGASGGVHHDDLAPMKPADEGEAESSEDHGTGAAHSSTVAMSVVTIVKAYIGSGIFGLPYAFRAGGWFLAPAGLALISVISNGCVLLLVDCKTAARSGDVRTFGQVGRAAFGSVGSAVVNANLVLTQAGFCAVYVIYLGSNLTQLLDYHLGVRIVPAPAQQPSLEADELNEHAFVFLVLWPALSLLCSLRSLRGLAPLSLVGSALVLTALCAVVWFARGQFAPGRPRALVRPVGPADSLPIFFSMAIYCFEGIGLALPIENAMREPEAFKPVWLISMAAVTCLFIAFGGYGYAAYGASTASKITDMLPRASRIATLVRLGVCGCLVLSFPMMMFPVFEIVEGKWPLKTVLRRGRMGGAVRISVRALIVLLVCTFASLIPDFGLVISLIGALGCNAMAFILPTIFHIKICWTRLGTLTILRDALIALFGTLALVVCTYTTVLKIVRGERTH